ncbi:MAG: LamG-like jellyroll fold domain-containing protein [Armatimonadota bacterium]|nr:DUF5703 domain-containing protein [Armatimonadota bacterium]MCX7778074.1 DUF5703 domain-containing protein [Armatimonadota bacterium]MDW8025753.1 LamG-like jellyroll fold domain-containing protein [Armatimonadota bacterium]
MAQSAKFNNDPLRMVGFVCVCLCVFLGQSLNEAGQTKVSPSVHNLKLQAPNTLIAWWRFEDEAMPGRDELGKHHAKPAGKVSISEGRFGNALWLDGNGFLEVEPSSEFDLTDAITIEAWVLPKVLQPAGMRIVDKTTVGTDEAYMIDTYPGLSLRFVGEPSHVTAKDILKLNEWQHVAATFDGRLGIIRLFVNGNIVAEQFLTRGKLSVNKNSLRIGADSLGGSRWVGAIDEVRIYSRALSPQEIALRSRGEETKPPTALAERMARKPSTCFRDGKMHINFRALLSRNDVVYLSPATFEFEAIPIGNGKLGAVVWNEDLLSFQLGHSDYYGIEFPSLCRIRIISEPSPWIKPPREFEQRLSLYDGELRMRAKLYDSTISAEAFVAEDIDAIMLRVSDARRAARKVVIEFWRKDKEHRWVSGEKYIGICESSRHEPDDHFSRSMCVLASALDADAIPEKLSDERVALRLTKDGGGKLTIAIAVGVAIGDTNAAVRKALATLDEVRKLGYEKLKEAHRRYWNSFWERSFVYLTDEHGISDYLENLWWLHMYWMAASSRGEFPPKFNGGIFLLSRDERCWGGAYWHQNQRQLSWSLFAANHIELVVPFFRLYERMLPAAIRNAKKFFGCSGAYFPETVFADGDPRGWRNQYTSHILTVGLEVALQMWWHYRYTGDEHFLRERFYPFAKECVSLYLDYLKRGDDGKLHLEPVHAQESFWLVRDSHTDLVALRWVLPLLIQLSRRYGVDDELRNRWQIVLEQLAPLPLKDDGTFAPADISPNPQRRNCENVELYGIFPFGVFGKGRLEEERAIQTFLKRPIKGICCGWNPSPIQAARLWLAEDAEALLLQHIRENQLLPQGFWYSPGNRKYGGLLPEMCYFDSSGMLAMAINEMLLQSDTGTIFVAPAIPKTWSAKFSLRAFDGFIVSSEIHRGEVLYVIIKSELGRECRVFNPWGVREVDVKLIRGRQAKTHSRLKGDVLKFSTALGEAYILTPVGKTLSSLPFEPLSPEPAKAPKYPGFKSLPPPWQRYGYPSQAHFPCLGISSDGKSPARDFVIRHSKDK